MTPDANCHLPIEPTQGDHHAEALPRTRSPYRRIRVLLAGLLAALVAGLTYYLATPSQYSACALIKIDRNAPFIAFEADRDDQRSNRFVNTQIEMIRSPVTLNRVVANQSAAACAELRESADPVAHLQDRLLISQVKDSDLWEIRYASASADDVESIVNAVVSEYISSSNRLDIDSLTRVISALDAELQSREVALTRLHETVLQLSRETYSPNPFSRNAKSRNEDRYDLTNSLRREASSVDLEIALLNAEQQRLASSASSLTHVDASLVELGVQNHPPIIEAELKVDKLKSQVDQLKEPSGEGATDENDAATELRRELGERRAALDQLKNDHRNSLRRKHAESHAREQLLKLESLREKTAALKVKKGILATRLGAAEKQLEADEGKLIELEFKLAELEREKRVFELIAARKLALETERNAPGRIELMSAAQPPSSPDPKVTLWKLGLVCGIAFLLPFVFAAFWPAHDA